MVGENGEVATVLPLDLTDLTPEDARLADDELEHRDQTEIDDLLFGYEHLRTNGYFDRPSRKLHLMYLHLYGPSGQQVRDVIADVDPNDVYEELASLNWGDSKLDQVIELARQEALWRQNQLALRRESGRIPLFRGIHCPSPLDETGQLKAHQKWAAGAMEKGLTDGTLEMVDGEFSEPTGCALNVAPFTHTVDNWTPSLSFAKHWATPRLPGNKFCMVLAAEVVHEAVVYWRVDAGQREEIIVRGGSGTVNVYFQQQVPEASWATPEEAEEWGQA